MTDQLATEPAEDEPASEPEVASEEAEETEAEASEQEAADDDGGEDDGPTEEPDDEPETVEIDLDGVKYRVPAALKDGYMQHADYTRKTQEVAAERKALEDRQTTLQQRAEQQQQHLKDYGELAHTDTLLEQFRKVDWQAVQREDPEQAQQLALQFQVMRDKREQIVEQIQKRDQELRVQAERDHAERADRLTATLARDIPNYTPKLREEMVNLATEVGFPREAVEKATDPNVWKVLHLAHLGREVLKRQKPAANSKPKEPVKPVPKAGGGRTPKQGVHDDLSTDEWMRREAKRVAKRQGRA